MMKSKKALYKELLQMFVGDADCADWIQEPFKLSNKVAASDRISLIALPGNGFEFPDRTEKCKAIYPLECNCNIPVSVQSLRGMVDEVPMVDCFDETKEKCSACNGECEVEYEFSHGGIDYEVSSECPVCDGEGGEVSISAVPNGKKKLNEEVMLTIEGALFNIIQVNRLADTAEKLGLDDISLVHKRASTNAYLFQLGEADLLMMPCINQ